MASSFNMYPASTSAIASHDVIPSSAIGCKATNGTLAADSGRSWTSSGSSALQHQEQAAAANGTGNGVQPAPVRTLSISRSGRFKSKSKQRARLSVDQIEPLTLAAEAIASGSMWMDHEGPKNPVSATMPRSFQGLASGEADCKREYLQRPSAYAFPPPPAAAPASSLKSAAAAGVSGEKDVKKDVASAQQQTESTEYDNESRTPSQPLGQNEVRSSTPPVGLEIAFESTSL